MVFIHHMYIQFTVWLSKSSIYYCTLTWELNYQSQFTVDLYRDLGIIMQLLPCIHWSSYLLLHSKIAQNLMALSTVISHSLREWHQYLSSTLLVIFLLHVTLIDSPGSISEGSRWLQLYVCHLDVEG